MVDAAHARELIARSIARHGGERWSRIERLTLRPRLLSGLVPWVKGNGRTFGLPSRAELAPQIARATCFDYPRAGERGRTRCALRPAQRYLCSVMRKSTRKPTPKPTTIDAYLATVKGEKRVALDKLRKTIRAVVPKAEECISYLMPAFRLDGKIVAGFAATTKGCSYFPFSGSTLRTLAKEVADYDQTKGSLHFDPARPLPATLVRKLIKARIAEG